MYLGKVFSSDNAKYPKIIVENCSLRPVWPSPIVFVGQHFVLVPPEYINWHQIKSQERKGIYFHTHIHPNLQSTHYPLALIYRSTELVILSSRKLQNGYFSSPSPGQRAPYTCIYMSKKGYSRYKLQL